MKGNLFKIRKGKEETWRAWCSLLANQYREEAIQTVIAEEGTFELFVEFKIGDDLYTVFVGDSKVRQYDDLTLRHRETAKECLEYLGSADILYHLAVTE